MERDCGAGGAADTLKGWDDPLAKKCLAIAMRAWDDEKAHPTPNQLAMSMRGAPAGGVLAASQGVVAGGPAPTDRVPRALRQLRALRQPRVQQPHQQLQ